MFAGAGRDVLTAAEIVAARATDAYQAVSQLRPEFLRRRLTRPQSPFVPIDVSVYVDDLPWGNADALRHIPLERVRVIRYISQVEADLRWGKAHHAGAILVTTKR